MDLKERIYHLSPIFIQNILIEVYGRKLVKRRYNEAFFNKLKEIRNRDRWEMQKLKDFQFQRLKRNLELANQHSEYYRQLFRDNNFSVSKFSSLEDIKQLPILNKSELRSNIDKVVNDHYKSIPYSITHTSGTTGAGLIYPESNACEREKWAVWWRFRLNMGIEFGSWVAFFTGRTIVPIQQKKPPYWRKVNSTKRLMFSMYHLNSDTVEDYVNKINEEKLTWFHGYPSFLSNLASLMINKGLQFDHEIEKISIGAENLLQSHISAMKQAFHVAPVQHYGLSEPVANISQCEFGRMHVDEDYSLVEFIPIDGLENQYRIVGTSFSNEAMLFLRYDTNDIATINPGKIACECGRESRMVASVDGRSEDFVSLKDGTKIGRMDHIFKDMINVVEAQIIQDKDGFIHFDVVKGPKYSQKDENELNAEIRSRINADYFDIRYKEEVPKTSSGKLRFVISEYEGPVQSR